MKHTDPAAVRVVADDQNTQRRCRSRLKVTELRFFDGAPGTVRVLTGDRETVYSLTLPDVGDSVWKAPAEVRRGIPRAGSDGVSTTDIWPWFAVLGGLGLLIDWLLFGRSRAFRLKATKAAIGSIWRKAS